MIDGACAPWIKRPNREMPLVDKLQSIIDQVLPGRLHIKIVSIQAGRIEGIVPYATDTANVVGVMHGGTIFTAGDTLAGALLWTTSDGTYFSMTRGCEIRYLRPLSSGNLRCTVTEKNRSERGIRLLADFYNDENQRVAQMKMDYVILPLKNDI